MNASCTEGNTGDGGSREGIEKERIKEIGRTKHYADMKSDGATASGTENKARTCAKHKVRRETPDDTTMRVRHTRDSLR